MQQILYIIYNANGSHFGKFTYGYKVLTSAANKPVCSACEMTHGGLRLEENDKWKVAKYQIEIEGGLDVKQLHRDELGTDVKSFVDQTGEPYPLVLLKTTVNNRKTVLGAPESIIKIVMTKDDLNSCRGDAKKFMKMLRERGVLRTPPGTSPAL